MYHQEYYELNVSVLKRLRQLKASIPNKRWQLNPELERIKKDILRAKERICHQVLLESPSFCSQEIAKIIDDNLNYFQIQEEYVETLLGREFCILMDYHYYNLEDVTIFSDVLEEMQESLKDFPFIEKENCFYPTRLKALLQEYREDLQIENRMLDIISVFNCYMDDSASQALMICLNDFPMEKMKIMALRKLDEILKELVALDWTDDPRLFEVKSVVYWYMIKKGYHDEG